MTPLHARAAVIAALLLTLPLAGCHDDLTQVVLVVESDLSIPGEVDGADVVAMPGPDAPQPGPFFGGGQPPDKFPLSIGFISFGTTANFSFVFRLLHGVFQGQTPALVVSRAVTDVRFVDQRTMMLVLQMPRACACTGSSCPTPDSNPACANIDAPTLQPFDPAVAPPSTMMPVARIP